MKSNHPPQEHAPLDRGSEQHDLALQGEGELDGRARILALKFVELPLPRQHPQRVGQGRLEARFHGHRGGLGFQPGVAQVDGLIRGRWVITDGRRMGFMADGLANCSKYAAKFQDPAASRSRGLIRFHPAAPSMGRAWDHMMGGVFTRVRSARAGQMPLSTALAASNTSQLWRP